MKFFIVNSPSYPFHFLTLPDWFAKQNSFYNQFKSSVQIVRETPKAYLLSLTQSGEEHWIPKSLCSIEYKQKLFEMKT